VARIFSDGQATNYWTACSRIYKPILLIIKCSLTEVPRLEVAGKDVVG
jgi:hypothetical protein